MDNEVWISIITTVVVPILLKVLVHYFPWLADAVTPEQKPPAITRQPAASDLVSQQEFPLDPSGGRTTTDQATSPTEQE